MNKSVPERDTIWKCLRVIDELIFEFVVYDKICPIDEIASTLYLSISFYLSQFLSLSPSPLRNTSKK